MSVCGLTSHQSEFTNIYSRVQSPRLRLPFARPRRVESGCLRALYAVPYALVPIGGFAENGRARDVGLIAFNAAPAVDQNDVAFAKLLRSHRAVRQGRILRKQDERKTMCRAKLAVSLSYLCG